MHFPAVSPKQGVHFIYKVITLIKSIVSLVIFFYVCSTILPNACDRCRNMMPCRTVESAFCLDMWRSDEIGLVITCGNRITNKYMKSLKTASSDPPLILLSDYAESLNNEQIRYDLREMTVKESITPTYERK